MIPTPRRDLVWKEWRATRWLFAALAALILILRASSGFVGAAHELPGIGMLTDLHIPPFAWPILGLAIGALTLGVNLLSPEEREPSRAFLSTLPLSRTAILRAKLSLMAIEIALLTLVTFIVAAIPFPGTQGLITGFRVDQVLLLALIPPGAFACMLLGCIIGLHLRSTVAAITLGLTAGAPLLAIAFGEALLYWEANSRNAIYYQLHPPSPPVAGLLSSGLFTLLLLGVSLYYLFCRSRLSELSPIPRALLGILFIFAMLEVVYTFAWCSFADLAYLLFGGI